MSQLFYGLARRLYRVGKFFEFPYFMIGNVVFFFHKYPAFGILRASPDNFASFYFLWLEICIQDWYGVDAGPNYDNLMFGDLEDE